MALSIMVAQLLSVVYAVVALGLLIGSIEIEDLIESFEDSAGLRLITGMITLVLGILLVKHHNSWVMNWTVLITIIGWIAVLKGALYIVFPNLLFKSAEWLESEKLIGLFALIMAGVLGYFGYIA